MAKCFFTISVILLLIVGLWADKAIADTSKNKSPHNIELLSNQRIGVDRRIPGGVDMYKTPFGKIEFLISQIAGLGYGRPGTEEFLNAEVIIKLQNDSNTYGFSLPSLETNGPRGAMYNTLMAALIHDFYVEITYYEKAGTKQMIRVTIKK